MKFCFIEVLQKSFFDIKYQIDTGILQFQLHVVPYFLEKGTYFEVFTHLFNLLRKLSLIFHSSFYNYKFINISFKPYIFSKSFFIIKNKVINL